MSFKSPTCLRSPLPPDSSIAQKKSTRIGRRYRIELVTDTGVRKVIEEGQRTGRTIVIRP